MEWKKCKKELEEWNGELEIVKNILSLDTKLQSSYYHYIIFLACINSAWW
jgi:hypothetical protein